MKTWTLKKCFTLIAIVGMTFPTWASGEDDKLKMSEIYAINTGHSYVGFSVKYMGYAKVRGRFADFKGTLRYDENDLSKTSITLVISVASLDTDLDWRDNDLKSDQWFDAENFPQMKFVSKRVVKRDLGFDVIGDITIRGITKEIIINMDPPSGLLKDIRGDSQVIFTGTTTINRNDFGVEGKRWSAIKEGIAGVGPEVNIELSILGKRVNAGNFKNRVRNPESPPGKLYKIANEQGVKSAIKEFDNMKATDEKINENALNIPAYMFLKEDKLDEALALFEHNAKAFPESGNVFDSLGEIFLVRGDYEKAKGYYQKALEKDPDNINAMEVLRHL